MQREEPRKIGRLPALGQHQKPQRARGGTSRVSDAFNLSLGESPLTGGLTDMRVQDMEPAQWSRPKRRSSVQAPVAYIDEEDEEEDEEEDIDFVPQENSDMDMEEVYEEDAEEGYEAQDEPDEPEEHVQPLPRAPRPAPTPARQAPTPNVRAQPTPGHTRPQPTPGHTRPQPTPRSQPASARRPARPAPRPIQAVGMLDYDAIDYDKITDPFKDGKRDYMRGRAPPPPAEEAPVESTPRNPRARPSLSAEIDVDEIPHVPSAPTPARATSRTTPRKPTLQETLPRMPTPKEPTPRRALAAHASPQPVSTTPRTLPRASLGQHEARSLAREEGTASTTPRIAREVKARVSDVPSRAHDDAEVSSEAEAYTETSRHGETSGQAETSARAESRARSPVAAPTSAATRAPAPARTDTARAPALARTEIRARPLAPADASPGRVEPSLAPRAEPTAARPSSALGSSAPRPPARPRPSAPRPSAPRPSAAPLDAPAPTAPAPSTEAPPARPSVAPRPSFGVRTPAKPTRSNRVITEQLLQWKARYIELEEEKALLEQRLANASDMDESMERELAEELEAVRQGQKDDRRKMRRVVRELESHIADVKVKYDERYWDLLTSSPTGYDSPQVQLVLRDNEITQLKGDVARLERQLALERHQSMFLVGLNKWRAKQARTAEADETYHLHARIAQLERELDAAHARPERIEAPASSTPPRPSAETPDASSSPQMQLQDIGLEPEPAAAPSATPVRPPLKPGVTPMQQRVQGTQFALDVESTPMLARTEEPQGGKKRKILSQKSNLFNIAEAASTPLNPALQFGFLSPTDDS